jgi:Bacterial Ig-like domain (group 2)
MLSARVTQSKIQLEASMSIHKGWSLTSRAFISGLILLLVGCGGGSNNTVTLTDLKLTPISPSISLGDTQQFTATADFSDNSSQDVTTTADWSSSNTSVSTISVGLAKGVGSGDTQITATYSQGSSTVSFTTSLQVNNSSSAKMEGTAILLVTSAPEAQESRVLMDGEELGNLGSGSSFSVEVPSGIHRFLSPDGKHTIGLDLRANTPYYFHVSSTGNLELMDVNDR